MSKIKSFVFGFGVAMFVAACLYDWKNMPPILNIDYATPFLIYWYMIWKLFHDKNKD